MARTGAFSAALLCLVGGATACGTMYRPEYAIAIEAVDVLDPDSAVVLAERTPGAPGSFEDDWIRTEWRLSNRNLDLEVQNVGGEMLRVEWDRASFIGVDGTSHRVGRRDLRLAEVGTLEPGGKEILALYPADYIAWENDAEVDWKSRPLIPHMPGIASSDRGRAEAFGRQQVGSSFKLQLPVDAGGTTRLYRVVFTVTDVTVREFMGT